MSTTPDRNHHAGPDSETPTRPARSARSQDPAPSDLDPADVGAPDHGDVLDRQKERFGGIKWGAAFFGWLTATGTALIITALAGGAGAAFGLATSTDSAEQAAAQAVQAAQDPGTARTAGIVSAVVVLVALLIAYYCGGYVAARMARFNGVRQGIAVWVWSVVIAIVVVILSAVAGSRFNILVTLNGFPRLPVDEGTLTTIGIVTAVVALVAALVGAAVGGLAGMRYHRRIDRTGRDR